MLVVSRVDNGRDTFFILDEVVKKKKAFPAEQNKDRLLRILTSWIDTDLFSGLFTNPLWNLAVPGYFCSWLKSGRRYFQM